MVWVWFIDNWCTILPNLPSTRGRSYSHHVSTGINICFSREERSEADNFLFQILALLYFSVVFSHIYNHVLAINIVHWGVVTHVTTKHFVWISKLIKCKSKSVEIEFILIYIIFNQITILKTIDIWNLPLEIILWPD